ncbi:hypothetical protein EDB89DRAFT_1994780 [Lactarius sanguifluus]|nr:hypothetical protein EDB89DRAFT_1994780 [Lactarius sanguifluus]
MPFSTKTPMVFYLAALALTAGSRQRVLAANDWLVPCTQGQCSWDLPADSGSSGTLQVWGPATAISDITPATGWRIITHCDPGCDGAGSPARCGPMPFARVTRYWTDQPNTPGSSTVTPRASDAQVHSLALDTNFAAATPPLNGTVSFTLQGLNVKGSNLNGASTSTTPASAHQRRWLSLRGPHGPPRHIHRRNFFGDMLRTPNAAQAPRFRSRPTASLSLDVDAAVHAEVSLGAVATGTLVPPKISEFGLTLGLDGNIDALFSIKANLTGHVSSGAIPIFQIGIPGLSFPGILEIGPEFKVTGEVDVDLALTNFGTDVRVTYNLSDVAAIFPPQHYETGGAFKQGTSEVTVSAAPDITDAGASATVTGHLIPQIDIGLSALGGIASATVFLNLDASTSLKVSASVDGSHGNKTAAPARAAQACVDANADLAVNLGARASFFDLFDASTGKTLFDKSFPLLQQVRSHALRAPLDGDDIDKSNSGITSRDLDLGCPLELVTQVSQLIKAIIPA